MGVNGSQPPAPCLLPPADNLVEVEKLVVQVKERTSNVQALSHGTVGQYLPVGSIGRVGGHAWQDPGVWRSSDTFDYHPPELCSVRFGVSGTRQVLNSMGPWAFQGLVVPLLLC